MRIIYVKKWKKKAGRIFKMKYYSRLKTKDIGTRVYTIKAKSLKHANNKMMSYCVVNDIDYVSIESSVQEFASNQDRYHITIDNGFNLKGQWLAL